MEAVETVTLQYHGKEIRVPVGTLLSDALGMTVPCGGHGRCGKCKLVARGALSEITESEREHLTEEELLRGVRLACRTQILGDAVAEPVTEDGAEETLVVSSGETGAFPIDPIFSRYGVAIDIGTTTLAARLYGRDGRVLAEAGIGNPQSRFGADVISRIEASLGGKGAALAETVRAAIGRLVLTLSGKAGISPREIDVAVVTGNTAMLYLLTETSPEPLSHAPFEADRLFGECVTAEKLGLPAFAGDATVLLPPCISAFVGADTVCAILATELGASGEAELLVDVGTNGEMALVKDGRLYVASTAAGPAFEGVGISMGTAASSGAIDRVAIVNGTLSAHVIGGGAARGICGSGLVDAVAALLDLETVDETGYLEDDPVTVAGPVTLTGRDIRMVQLAKSAISAGIGTLFHTAGVSVGEIATLYVAGGFGNYLDLRKAERIGLFPKGLADRATVSGNAALGGAATLLLSRSAAERARQIAADATVVELSTSPTFADLYIENMAFDA